MRSWYRRSHALSNLQTSPSSSNDSTQRKKCNSTKSSRVFAVRGPQPARTVSSQKDLPPPPNLLPSLRTAAFALLHLILVPVSNTHTWISASTYMGRLTDSDSDVEDDEGDYGEHESDEASSCARIRACACSSRWPRWTPLSMTWTT